MISTNLLAAVVAGGVAIGNAATAESHEPHHSGVSVEAGDLIIENAFARATRPGAPVAVGYMTIVNDGDEGDRLIGMSSPLAERGEIHEMAMDGDVMRMRALPDGLPIPAGETVTLAPGGYHLMFLDLAGPLVRGEVAPVTLTFEIAGEVSLSLSIAATDAQAPESVYKEHDQ